MVSRRAIGRKAPLLAAVAVGMVTLTAAGCGGSSSTTSAAGGSGSGGQSAQGAKMQNVKLIASGADTYPYDGLITVAQKKGWFKQAGINLTLITSDNGGGGVAQILASGGANLGIGSGASAVPLAENPSANVVLLDNWYPANDFAWLTPKSGASINGATLGYTSPGSSTDLMLKAIRSARPSWNFKQVPLGSPGANWAAAKAGKVTAGWELPPYTQQLTAQQGAHVLLAGRSVVGDIPADLVYANKSYAKQNPEVIRGFFKVMDRAFTYARTKPAAAAADLSKVISVNAKYIRQSIEQYRGGYTVKLNPESLTNLSKVLVSTHTISAPVQWTKLLDQAYLPRDAQSPLPKSG